MSEPFTVAARIKSFRYAFAGIATLVRREHNARIHLVATLVVLWTAAYYSVERWEWMGLLLAIGGVWAAEAINTAIECLADACHPEQHEMIGQAKDVAAAAVLLFSFVAVAVAALVFYPYILPS